MFEANADIAANKQTSISTPTTTSALGVPTLFIGVTSLLRTGFKHLLSGTRFVVSEADVDATLNLPDGALVLIACPSTASFAETTETIRQLKAQNPQVRVCVLADRFELGFVVEARKANADGFCLSSVERDVLIRSLELIMLGEHIVPSTIIRSVLDQLSRSAEYQLRQRFSRESPRNRDAFCKLSSREGEILRSLMIGAPNKVIARQFGVTEATVKVHVKAILRKIGAKNRTQAAMWAANHISDVQDNGSSAKSIM